MSTIVQKSETAIATDIATDAAEVEGLPLVVRLSPVVELSEDQFFELCQINDEVRIERNAQGELLLMPPAGGGSSRRNMGFAVQVGLWAEQDGTGIAFDSSAGFLLPNGAMRSPDLSWMERLRLDQIPDEQQERFIPACPDFVLELRSRTDSLRALQRKMQEYLDNGSRLGWLFDPRPRHLYVYQPGVPVERQENVETISGDPVLPGFILDLRKIW